MKAPTISKATVLLIVSWSRTQALTVHSSEMIEQRAKELRSSDLVKREVRELREAVAGNEEHRHGIRTARYINMKPSEIWLGSEYPASAEQFGRELERLEIDNEQGWDKEKPSGRLNCATHNERRA